MKKLKFICILGMMSETPARDALVGPTTLCILGDQFARLKKGDRFFYENGAQPGSFSSQQLEEVLNSFTFLEYTFFSIFFF